MIHIMLCLLSCVISASLTSGILFYFSLLRCFFKRNDVRYLSEIEFAEIKILGWNLKHWCYVDGHDEFYN